MAIIRDTNLWLAEVLERPYQSMYEDIFDSQDYRFNWVIEQEIRGVLASIKLPQIFANSFINRSIRNGQYLFPNSKTLGAVQEVYENCRIAVDSKQDVKDVYIAGYAVFYQMPVVTHDLEFTKLEVYEPRLEVITRRSGRLKEMHPREYFSSQIEILDEYMLSLCAKEIELAGE